MKKNNKNNKSTVANNESGKLGGIIYEMPKRMAEALVDKHTPKSVVMTQEYLCNYVDEQMHLKEKCVRVDLI